MILITLQTHDGQDLLTHLGEALCITVKQVFTSISPVIRTAQAGGADMRQSRCGNSALTTNKS
jgi:hypothetical protein